MVTKFNPSSICPYWARFIFKSDGHWIAHCSKIQCGVVESARPGTLANTDFPHEEKCKVGFSEGSAVGMPVVMWGIYMEVDGYYYQELLSEEEWDKIVDDFIETGPRGAMYNVYY